MPFAEFEEKQYEVPANIELGLQQAGVFAAGQVLEAVVGYDVAADPPLNAPIWQLVGATAPQGTQLVPNLWQRARVRPQPADLPSAYVSLIFQYKRPQYLTTSQAAQWHHWNRPYYRFSILQHQQDTLEVLEKSLWARAVVRYACPAFWKYADLQSRQQAHGVLANSAFVLPSSLSGHQVWTYDVPGTSGFANSMEEDLASEDWRDVFQHVESSGWRRKENLYEHLRGLGAGVGVPEITDNTSPAWLTTFAIQNRLNSIQRQALLDVFRLAEQIGRAGSSWFVVDLGIPNP